MKRTEAIAWLEVMKEDAIFEQYDALKMAIEALQITETPIDLVSRADAIELCADAQGRANTKAELKGISKVWQGLLKLPSAKPTGELISRGETPTNAPTDLISRADALKPFCIAPDGTRIPEVDCDNFPVEFNVEFIKKTFVVAPVNRRCKS